MNTARTKWISRLFAGVAGTLIGGLAPAAPSAAGAPEPGQSALFRPLTAMDIAFSDAYNRCATTRLRSMFASGAEIYFGGRGRVASVGDFIDRVRANECGRYERRIDEGATQVYGLPPGGALQVGSQRFCRRGVTPCRGIESTYLVVWKQVGEDWKISRLVRFGYRETMSR